MLHLRKILKYNFDKVNCRMRTKLLPLTSSFCTTTEQEVKHEPENYMFIVGVGPSGTGGKAVLEYSREKDVLDFYYTYVPPIYRGRGIGKTLARSAFTFIEANNLKMNVSCDYLKKILEQNSHYKKFLA